MAIILKSYKAVLIVVKYLLFLLVPSYSKKNKQQPKTTQTTLLKKI